MMTYLVLLLLEPMKVTMRVAIWAVMLAVVLQKIHRCHIRVSIPTERHSWSDVVVVVWMISVSVVVSWMPNTRNHHS